MNEPARKTEDNREHVSNCHECKTPGDCFVAENGKHYKYWEPWPNVVMLEFLKQADPDCAVETWKRVTGLDLDRDRVAAHLQELTRHLAKCLGRS